MAHHDGVRRICSHRRARPFEELPLGCRVAHTDPYAAAVHLVEDLQQDPERLASCVTARHIGRDDALAHRVAPLLGEDGHDITEHASAHLLAQIAHFAMRPVAFSAVFELVTRFRDQHLFGLTPELILAIDARLTVFWAESFVAWHREQEIRLEAQQETPTPEERAARAMLSGTAWLHWHLLHADAEL